MVTISWPDDPCDSVLPVEFLARFRQPGSNPLGGRSAAVLWDGQVIPADGPAVSWEHIMSGDEGVLAVIETVSDYGFCIAAGTPATLADSEALLRRFGYVRETIFGGMWEFSADLAMADTAYTNLELRPHTDGTYSNDAPGWQLLHCLGFVGTGGESTVVDAFAVAARLRSERPDLYSVLSTVEVPGQYIGDGSHLMAARPVLRHDASGHLVQVSCNNYDRAPFLLAEDEMLAFYDALRAFESLVNDPSMQWRHVLAPGEAMLFDNWRVLHGRLAFTGQRTMCGGYVNHEDIDSRRRMAIS
jgi:trimethyllysine dioxygenase